MNRVRLAALIIVAVVVGFVSFGLFSRPQVESADSAEFSAERVARDIEVISRQHHSVAHPEERAEVREYLVERLTAMGADTVKLFEHKALTGPENKHVTYTFDATNILAEFSAKHSESSPKLMFIAHYDSRYSQPMPQQDTVWSYGAADDGYGIGIALEATNLALKYRDEWQQGIKILFTDAEEVGMKGMKALWENNREEFADVGLVINIEARGPYGPALLFETSPGNNRLMELYASAADYPYTYSLTTVVYGFMPNFTDFTIIKDSVPGFNFSTVADINHYHTDLDNYSNINLRSIQHYGSQIVPILRAYLTDAKYSNPESLRSDSDTVNFTLPALGLFNFSKGTYWTINIVVVALFVALLVVEIMRGRAQGRKVMRSALTTLIVAICGLILGELIAWMSSAIAGAQFKPFGIVQGIAGDNAIMAISVALILAAVVVIYLRKRRNIMRQTLGSVRSSAADAATAINANNALYGALSMFAILSIVLLVAIGENLMFFIPLTAATLSLVLYRLTNIREWYLVGIALTLLHALSFLYTLAMALTIGAFGAVVMLALFDAMLLIPLVESYVRKA